MKPRVLILHATGTNRDLDLAAALELAGAKIDVVHLNQLRSGERRWADYQMLALPGGFSYADALGAGRLFALDLIAYFAEQLSDFVAQGKPVIGICNGFQALVKAGVLPVPPSERVNDPEVKATLTFNEKGHFECRWVTLSPRSQRCLWTRGLAEPIDCPVAHGEGNFFLADSRQLTWLQQHDQVALIYAHRDGSPAQGAYPENPNGSAADIAGICNPQGNVLGLMPHPENHLYAYQHPHYTRNLVREGRSGLNLFRNGVQAAAQC